MGRLRAAAGLLALWALCTSVSADRADEDRRAPRRPVAPPMAAAGRIPQRASDPLVERVHSLLAGLPIRRGGVDVIPLFARVPSEASSADPALPDWRPAGVRLGRAAPGVVRIRHDGPGAVLLIPGMFVRLESTEYQLLRVGSVAPGGSLFVPAREAAVERVFSQDATQGLLPAADVARILLGEAPAGSSGTASTRGAALLPTYPQLARDAAPWFARSESVNEQTCVGCVTLLGGEVLAAHVFASHRLFRDAWPDLLATAVSEQRRAVRAGVPVPDLAQRAARGSPRGRALLALRTLTAEPGRTREIPGGGQRWESGGRGLGLLGRGLIAPSGRVVYFGLYRVPPAPQAADTSPAKPAAPAADPVEEPTGRRGGRFNPFGGTGPGSLPGNRPDPLAPPR